MTSFHHIFLHYYYLSVLFWAYHCNFIYAHFISSPFHFTSLSSNFTSQKAILLVFIIFFTFHHIFYYYYLFVLYWAYFIVSSILNSFHFITISLHRSHNSSNFISQKATQIIPSNPVKLYFPYHYSVNSTPRNLNTELRMQCEAFWAGHQQAAQSSQPTTIKTQL